LQPVFRFAPSPNGELHLGHAFSALLNHELARRQGGRFLLRIEDIDPARCRPEYEAAILDDLAWLGLEWETPVRRQSGHMDEYRAAASRLRAEGLAYPAFMSRSEIAATTASPGWPRDPDGAPLYPGNERNLDPAEAVRRIHAGDPYTLRLDTNRASDRAGPLSWHEEGEGPEGETGMVEARPGIWGDFIIARRDVPTAYHLAVVVDDAAQGVTHVVRGRDLFFATAAHRLLQALLGLPVPTYRHHRLILDGEGRKLSKSNRATSLRSLREAGATPADIRRLTDIDGTLAALDAL